MKKVIVTSLEDPASVNIRKFLLENYNFKETGEEFDGNPVYKEGDLHLITINGRKIEAEYLNNIEADLIIFASRHAAKSGIPTLTVHADGNWCENTLGGKPEKISIAPALYMREALLSLKELRDENNLSYDVSLEVTHHGPNLDIPSLWVEIGSTETQWNDLKAAEIVAEVIYRLRKEPRRVPVFVGFGGTHYAPTFTKIVLEKEYAVGHMIPKYALDCVSERLIAEAYLRTIPTPDFGVIDWKGCNSTQRNKIIKVFEENGWRFRKAKEILKL